MSLQLGQWNAEFRPRGWVRLSESGDGPSVYAEFIQSGPPGQERFDMRSVVMRAGSGEILSARTWRRIPFSDVETMMRIPDIRRVLTAESAVPAPSLSNLDAYFDATEADSTITAVIPTDVLHSDGADGLPAGSFPLVKAPDGRLTDEFLRDVAEAYTWLTEANRRPAPGIADMAEVPVRTVHRWIYEARKRGILPPARPGRAG
ncbi:hypothetical protein [Kitasatospora purpeofusca]|uniref:hypothetical protein n=1 Tax=Kitasatospora purpeofusca TaxID=67352 RepID=UPI00382066D8